MLSRVMRSLAILFASGIFVSALPLLGQAQEKNQTPLLSGAMTSASSTSAPITVA